MDLNLIEYTTAERMASVYRTSVAKLKSLVVQLGEESATLKEVFGVRCVFDVDVYFEGSRHDANPDAADAMAECMKRAAWGQLIDKLGVRKIMSSKRAAELDDAIQNKRRYSGDAPCKLPEISEETICSVLAGMVQSADEFLNEAIREEYDFWKPEKQFAPYVRNSEFTLNRKIIRPCIVERTYDGKGWRPNSYREQHVTALDNIFHMLDGQGFAKGHYGPLNEAIRTCGPEGVGETDLFKFRCCKNGNLHLEFKRLDLLQRFNQVAGRNRLPQD